MKKISFVRTMASILGVSLLSASAIAAPIRDDLLSIRYANFTPKNVNIPTDFFCGGSCGFTSNQPFLFTITVRNQSTSGLLSVTAAHAKIIEVDEFTSDVVGNFIQTANLPVDLGYLEEATIHFGMNVDPTSLNAQCGGGCDSNLGYTLEYGALEFAGFAFLDFRLDLASGQQLDFSTSTFPGTIPEPASAVLLASGLAALAASRKRRKSRPATDIA